MTALWTHLHSNPLTWLTLTLVVYQAAHWLWRRSGMMPLLNPVLLSIAALSTVLTVAGIDYARYFSGAQIIHFLLGPATVALAIPLYKQLNRLRQSFLALLVGLLAGSVAAILASLALGWALGASRQTIMSLTPKSATSPIAMGIAEQIGGLPSLTAVLAILTGIIGAVGGGWLMDRLRITDDRARGVAMGTASHGIGTARALQMGEVTGAFSGLAMGLNGIATALLAPILVKWLMG
ncbi:LrgB family protein [Magnetospirillum gryphiswaldense]|uniref:LrgB-like protein n=1 Tax=Magnetospirillum gryphiswaldense TaxID=55518 RepID=A4TVD5_9PROT|nr:LrgB family protein [Magnetospirillum gryphiswaldense]AVM73293.1 Inner membrane protein YohK [Magnetospirillum gryphiswaldense MSR-1]AVM77196.1 Inner membrane protein YohK [Magnetospirillum gryphiswaldense]CAM74592.1 LrgB-like protein [Magnetospirillum gryphiswaldense MSR-1]